MDKIKLYDNEFILSITSARIQEAVSGIAAKINRDLEGESPLFISILNGAFMFTSDLLKQIKLNCRVSFLKISSYQGSSSTGRITELIGLNEDIKGETIVILEDIVDTGTTLEGVTAQLKQHSPRNIKIATLLLKPEVFKGGVKLDYVGLEIPNDFIVGYGLDYKELGRNYKSIYKRSL